MYIDPVHVHDLPKSLRSPGECRGYFHSPEIDMDAIRADYQTADASGRVVATGHAGFIGGNPGVMFWKSAVECYRVTWGGCWRLVYAQGGYAVSDQMLTESPEFRAYLLGDMPPYAFADYLEETVPDIDQRALHLLRLPYRPEPVVTSGRNLGQD